MKTKYEEGVIVDVIVYGNISGAIRGASLAGRRSGLHATVVPPSEDVDASVRYCTSPRVQ